jgi:hypothetical protein
LNDDLFAAEQNRKDLDRLLWQEEVLHVRKWIHNIYPELCACDACDFQRFRILEIRAAVVESADTPASNTGAFGREGSSPSGGTQPMSMQGAF